MIKLNILIVITSSRIRRDNKASLICRITYDKSRKQFSTGLFINPKHWNSKQQYVEPQEPDSELKNTQLSLIKIKLSQAYNYLGHLYKFIKSHPIKLVVTV